MLFYEFVNLLEAQGLKPRQQPNRQWRAHCPAHDDKEPSLSFTESDGRILVNCFAGCTVDAICAALGITTKDLRTDQDFERRITYEVHDPDGTLVALHERIERNGKKTFVWRHADGRKAQGDLKIADLPLYGVHKLNDANFVVIVEGEKCAEALWSVGVPAVATYGATCDPADEPLKQVIERTQTIYLWSDNDDAGRKHMARLGKRLLELGATDVRLVDWSDAPEKGDAADAVELGVDIRALLDAAKPFEVSPAETPQDGSTPTQTSPQNQRCPFCQLTDAELFAKAQPLLEANDPLQEAVERIRAAFGIVGEDANLRLLLLALTTRIFPQPVNVLVTGGTGQGKSFLTDAACATLPPCCHRRIVGASARALLFHPLAKGTILQWLELPALDGDTIAATILRSILWQAPQETATDYLFVEWTPKGARRRSVQMPRQVALVTTKVELPKDEQLLSRFLILEVRESADKRKAVLTSLAASFNGDPDAFNESALEPVQAFAEWLGRYKVRVTIPFAYALAELFAELPASERDFRDFATLLKLVAACALWNLQKRQHSIDGDSLRVTADLSDYAMVYRLLLPVWGKPRSSALSESERKVAEALWSLAQDHPPTAEEITQVLSLSRRTVERHLRALADKGFAERGEKRGRFYEWRPVGSLDALTPTLPSPEAVLAAWQPDRPDGSTPTGDQPDRAFSDISDSQRQSPLSLKISENASDIVQNPLSDISDTGLLTISDASDSEVRVRKLSDIFSAGEASPISNENAVADVAEAKNPSGTRIFQRQTPLSLNVADVAEDQPDAPTEPQKSETELPIDLDSGLDVKIVCKICGSWRRIPPDAFMLTDPLCDICSSVMTPDPEGDHPPSGSAPTLPTDPTPTDPAPTSAPQPDRPDPDFVDAHQWLDQWQREVSAQSDQTAIIDLETGEPVPVADLPPTTRKEAQCPRCGHSETVDASVLLPPICRVCGAAMVWRGDD